MADENQASPGSTPPANGEAPAPVPAGQTAAGTNHAAPPPGAFSTNPLPPTQITLKPPATRSPAPSKAPDQTLPPQEIKDNFREVVETIVFVVVLVLLLKTFLAEAFVIPTGSMATTLLGYHYQVTCDKCRYPFPVNASHEADPQEGEPQPVVSCHCPNCGYRKVLRPDLDHQPK